MSEPTYTAAQVRSMKRDRRLAACVGKTPFESRAIAEAVARRRRGQRKDNHAYKCKGCGKYHLGSKTEPVR